MLVTTVPVINASDIRLANTNSLGMFIVEYKNRLVYMHSVDLSLGSVAYSASSEITLLMDNIIFDSRTDYQN
jgi:hypothetical protein